MNNELDELIKAYEQEVESACIKFMKRDGLSPSDAADRAMAEVNARRMSEAEDRKIKKQLGVL